MEQWSDNAIRDIIGAFRVFVVSMIIIFGALAVVNALYPKFPFDNNSYFVISVMVGLFVSLLKYINKKNAHF